MQDSYRLRNTAAKEEIWLLFDVKLNKWRNLRTRTSMFSRHEIE